jgi:hypothetical protein
VVTAAGVPALVTWLLKRAVALDYEDQGGCGLQDLCSFFLSFRTVPCFSRHRAPPALFSPLFAVLVRFVRGVSAVHG